MSETKNHPPITILLTQGDPAGIGPELAVRAARNWGRPADCRLVVVGYPAHCYEIWPRDETMPVFGELEAVMEAPAAPGVEWAQPGFASLNEPVELGRPSARSGQAAARCIEAAIDFCMTERADAICTAPINKDALRAAGYAFPGHTELLAQRSGTQQFAMMLIGGGLRVVLATIHESLARVPELLGKRRLVDLFHLVHRSMPDFGFDAPRIGVAGLNPHAGENGMFGREEIEIISPAIDVVRSHGLDVSGPLPGDTIFHRMIEGDFDAVIAMYHDQGLAPLKTLAFHEGVNTTIGLPFVRTSPDHGTAYDLAGKGQARLDSILAALNEAYGQASRRRELQSQTTAF